MQKKLLKYFKPHIFVVDSRKNTIDESIRENTLVDEYSDPTFEIIMPGMIFAHLYMSICLDP